MATISKTKNPSKPWRVQIRRKGSPSMSQYFATNADAKRWAREQETKVDKNPNAPAGLQVTYTQLTETYIDKIMGKPQPKETKGQKEKRRELRRIAKMIGPVRIAELRGSVLHNYAIRVKQRNYSGSTTKRMMNYVTMVLSHASGFHNVEEAASVSIMHMKTARLVLRQANAMHVTKRTRRPTPEEIERLLTYFTNRLKDPRAIRSAGKRPRVQMADIVLFAICTCMRQGEILKITWEDFSANRRTVWIRNRKDPSGTKSRDDEVPLLVGHVTIDGHAVNPIEIISHQPTAEHRRGRIFPFSEHSVGRMFREGCRELGIKNLHFHDLRHDGVSRLFESKRPIEEVSMVSGHRSWADLKTYTNLNPASLHHDVSPS